MILNNKKSAFVADRFKMKDFHKKLLATRGLNNNLRNDVLSYSLHNRCQ